MKKRSFIGTLGLMALSMAGAGVVAPAPSAQSQTQQAQNQAQKTQKNDISKHRHEMRTIQSAGGFDVVGHHEGIPPKIYGQHFVKRGTHKRSNRR